MRVTRSVQIGSLVVLALLLVTSSSSAQSVFKIRHVDTQGDLLMVYHNPSDVEQDAEVKITVGGSDCTAVKGAIRLPVREKQNPALLIVIDRGGTKKKGMGPHAPAIVNGVRAFVKMHLTKNPKDRIAIAETPGAKRAATDTGPTSDAQSLTVWLNNLEGSAGAGADIYGTTKTKLQLLDEVDTLFRGVIIISDGLDPHTDEGTGSHYQRLIDAAKKNGISISALHIDRSSAVPSSKRGRIQGGRVLLSDLADETDGKFESVAVGDSLAPEVITGLKMLESKFSNARVTSCTLCGAGYDTTKKTPVVMRLKKEGVLLSQSRKQPEPAVTLTKADYGACEGDEGTCESADDCEGCGSCSEEACTTDCSGDGDCPDGCTCEDGSCKKEKKEKEGMSKKTKILIGVGVLLALGLILLLVALSRKKAQAKEAAWREAEAEREAAAKEALRQSEIKSQEELERQQRETSEIQKQVDSQKNEMAAMEDRMHPILYRLVSSDGSIDLPLRVGVHVLGGDPSCDMVFNQPTISGTHAQITVTAEGAVGIDDLQSSNGTFLNGYQIEPGRPVQLEVGDILGLSKQLELQIAPVDGTPSAPPTGGPQRGKTMLEE
jgi:hypothetical protein